VPVASQTAWHGIFTHGHLEKGQTISIHGGAGAVGAYAVQLASHAGATVIATASNDDEAYLNSIGASRVIDYRESEFEKVLREKVDLVSATQPVPQEEAARHRVLGMMMRLAPSVDILGKIARLLEEGTIRPERRHRVRAQGCGPGMEGHRRESARGSWVIAHWAGSGKTQVTRQDRASRGLEIVRT
jgi:NAD(P)-dependent dehydrogenase (short-subunit alcohol dehydrogenase family)